MSWLQRLRIDKFLLVLICVVALASFFPCRGIARVIFENLTTAAIALLFFMHGAKLSREAILGGVGHWKLGRDSDLLIRYTLIFKNAYGKD